jgi:hypothetical protein
MLSSHLRLGLPTGLLPSGFPTKMFTSVKIVAFYFLVNFTMLSELHMLLSVEWDKNFD